MGCSLRKEGPRSRPGATGSLAPRGVGCRRGGAGNEPTERACSAEVARSRSPRRHLRNRSKSASVGLTDPRSAGTLHPGSRLPPSRHSTASFHSSKTVSEIASNRCRSRNTARTTEESPSPRTVKSKYASRSSSRGHPETSTAFMTILWPVLLSTRQQRHGLTLQIHLGEAPRRKLRVLICPGASWWWPIRAAQ